MTSHVNKYGDRHCRRRSRDVKRYGGWPAVILNDCYLSFKSAILNMTASAVLLKLC